MKPQTALARTAPPVCSLALAPASVAAIEPLTLDQLLDPFAFLSITDTYARYSLLIDFTIYTLIFVGLAQAILARQYTGRGGRAVAVGVGVALSLGMLLAEETFDFNLHSFGPFAATLVVLLLGITAFGLLHGVGMRKTGAASTAYVLVFFTLRAVSPELFDWMNAAMPLLGLAALIALAVSAFGALSALLPGGAHLPQLLQPPRGAPVPDPLAPRRRALLDAEQTAIGHTGRPLARRTAAEGRTIAAELHAIRNAVRTAAADPAAREELLERLRRVLPRLDEQQHDILRVRVLTEQLRHVDETVLHRDVHERLLRLPPKARARLEVRLRDETGKLNLEHYLKRLEEGMAIHLEATAASIDEAGRALIAGQAPAALVALDRAVTQEKAIRGLAAEAERLEKHLLHVVRRQKRLDAA